MNHRTYYLSSALIVIAIVACLNFYISLAIAPTTIFNIYSLIIYCGACIVIWQDSKFNWLFFLYLFGLFSILISCFIDEYLGIYLIEVETKAFLSGATSRAASLSTIFISSTYFFTKIYQNIFSENMVSIIDFKSYENKLYNFVIITTIIYTLASLLYTVPPLFTVISRFDYFHDSAFPAFRFFYTLIPFLAMFLSISYINKKISRNLTLFYAFFLLIIPILTGEKFSLFIDIFYYSITPFIIYGFIRVNNKLLFKFSCVFFLLIGMVFINYIRRGDDLNILMTRMSLQGEMIFALDLLSINRLEFNWQTVLESFFGLSSDLSNRGMYHLMYQVAPPSTVDLLVQFNQTFTAPFPANFQYFFSNEFSPPAILIYSIPVAYSIFTFRNALLSQSYANIFCAAVLFHYLSISTMMGKTERLLHPITIISFIYTLVLLVIGQNWTKINLKWGK